MTANKLYIYIIITVLFSFDIYLSITLQSTKRQFKEERSNSELLSDILLRQTMYGSSLKFTDYIEVEDLKNQVVDLKSVFGDSPKLIFRFSEMNCNACIVAELPMIKTISSDVGKENIILLGSFPHINALKSFKKIHEIDFSIYNVDSELLEHNLAESLNVPFYFVINSYHNPQSLFFPEKTRPLLSKSYLNSVAKLYFHDTIPKLIKLDRQLVNDLILHKGETKLIEFNFINISGRPLKITNVESDCDCTVAHWSKDYIGIDQSSRITLSFTGNSQGHFLRHAYITFEGAKVPIKVIISGIVTSDK